VCNPVITKRPLIEIVDLSKSYNHGSLKALDSLNLVIYSGELFGFLGPNGAGKTTTIKTMVSLTPPDSGTVLLNSHDIATDPIKAKQQFGYVPEKVELYERLTGIEYLTFLANIYEIPPAEREPRLTPLAVNFGIREALPDLIQSYSHGMKQKLAIIGAMIHRPQILVLDEPVSGLDPKSSYYFKEQLRLHCRRGGAVFFSTHILEIAEKLCERIGIIHRGKLVSLGTVEELRISAGENKSLEQIFLQCTDDEA
jgi:ABC-2 type transport system ATP-binding protein